MRGMQGNHRTYAPRAHFAETVAATTSSSIGELPAFEKKKQPQSPVLMAENRGLLERLGYFE